MCVCAIPTFRVYGLYDSSVVYVLCMYMVSMVVCIKGVEDDFKQVQHIKPSADDHALNEIAVLVIVKS